MAIFVQDTFTDTSGTALNSHTGEVGATWAAATPSGTMPVISNANRLRCNGASSGYSYASGTPASNEYDVEADMYVASIAGNTGVCGRWNAPANETGYRLRYNAIGTSWELHKMVSGAATTLGSVSQTLSVGSTYRMKLEIRDIAKKVYVDSVEIISSADNAITLANKVGVRIGSVTSASDTVGMHLDNFVATDLSGGGADRMPLGIYVPRISRKSIRHMGV